MEPRKIVVVSTKTQKKQVIMSSATTLGELKSDLRANNIDYTDMDFYEGIAKVQLKTDDSILPHDVPYKGTITNELVFMLTTMNKKIRSGVTTRAEAYLKIKELGIQEEIKKKFGKNFTQCSTKDLFSMIDKYTDTAKKSTWEKGKVEAVEEHKTYNESEVNPVDEIAKQILDVDAHLNIEDIIADLTNKVIDLTKRVDNLEHRIKSIEDNRSNDAYDNDEDEEEDEDIPYSNDDIEDMFDFVE